MTHFLEEPVGFGDARMTHEFACCGARIRYVDDDDDGEEDPADMYPYCYQGRHWEAEIATDDEEAAREGNEADEMVGIEDDDVPRVGERPVWWRGWRTKGMTCEKRRCKESQR